jgi:PBP1b-binding outer membrane lipoprotein LpoB
MPATILLHRARRMAVALIAASLLGACDDDDPTEPDEEPAVAAVRLTVGANSVTVSTTASPTLNVTSGSNTVTAQWLKADGTVEALVTDTEFELRLAAVTGTNLTWTPTGAFGGTLTVTGLTGGQTAAARVSLFHKVEQHDDFGPLNFTVRVP